MIYEQLRNHIMMSYLFFTYYFILQLLCTIKTVATLLMPVIDKCELPIVRS